MSNEISSEISMTPEEMMAEIIRLKNENAAAKQALAVKQTISFKVSEKGAVSVYGMGRFPVTLYRGQWERLLSEEVRTSLQGFMNVHKATLDAVEAKSVEAKAAAKAANEQLANVARQQRIANLGVTIDPVSGKPVTTGTTTKVG